MGLLQRWRYQWTVAMVGGIVGGWGAAWGDGGGSWSYSGTTGPEHWGRLSNEFVLCRIGRNQSPIDIRREQVLRTELRALEFLYESPLPLTVIYTGRGLEVPVHSDRFRLRAEGETFQLVNVHFHTPSEHADGGVRYPLEAHLVHRNARGELAVVGVWFRSGEDNPALTQILQLVPTAGEGERGEEGGSARKSEEKGRSGKTKGKEGSGGGRWQRSGGTIDVRQLLPRSDGFFRYSGSLTTPPCSEGVRWYVMQEPVMAGEGQLQTMRAILGENARPLQPLYARRVLE
ncbi:MAG: carbonic anhydrase family protein [Hydrogenophilus sp.]|nr:carbonic anhydrase family protein [Hydrogenophilus sp.]